MWGNLFKILVDRKRNWWGICSFLENWPQYHRWYNWWFFDARQRTNRHGLWHYWKRYKVKGNISMMFSLSNPGFLTRFSFLRMYLNFHLIFSLGWLSLSWVFPRRSILKSSCTTVPKPTNEELSHDGRTTSRGLRNTKLSRRIEFHLRSYQKGNMS